jgi:[lysine-biosynthesis-protein LysW]--L-2-aminoadipate ligase
MSSIVLLFDRVRWEEKKLGARAVQMGIDLRMMDARELLLGTTDDTVGFVSVALQRCVSHSRGLHVAEYMESKGAKVINSSVVGRLCGDKLSTSMALARAGIPHPKTIACFSIEAAMRAAEDLGYPVVTKPINGSWGRNVAVLSDPRSLRSYLELRESSGNPEDHIYYLQEFVKIPGRDIRCVCVGDMVVASIYRYAEPGEWRTNVALGGRAEPCPLDARQKEIVLKAAQTVGGGVLGVDCMEGPDGLMVHEINSNVEFKGASSATGADVAGRIIEYVKETASR